MKKLLITFGAGALLCGCGPLDGEVSAARPERRAAPTRLECKDACPTGSLDTTFGGAGTGIARWSIKPDDAGGFTALDIDLSSTGIVAAGWGLGGLGGSTFKLARLEPDGTPDPSFGEGDVVETQWGASTANYAAARAVGHQQGGRIVAIGTFDDIRSQDIALARYEADGTLDTRFAGDGKPLVDLGGSEIITSGLVAPDDSILAAGARDGQLLVARFTPEGEIDTSFGGGKGYFAAQQGESSQAEAVTLDGDGKILVAGSTNDGQQRDLLVMRLTRSGDPDPSFGEGGVVVAGKPGLDEHAAAIAVTASGNIVVAGDTGGDKAEFLVRRFRPGGAPDLSFGDGGVTAGTVALGASRAEAMALLPCGEILVVGNSRLDGVTGPLVARYTRLGALDPTFGTGGILPLDLGEYGVAHTVVIDARHGALIGGGDEGATPGPGTYAVIARLCM